MHRFSNHNYQKPTKVSLAMIKLKPKNLAVNKSTDGFRFFFNLPRDITDIIYGILSIKDAILFSSTSTSNRQYLNSYFASYVDNKNKNIFVHIMNLCSKRFMLNDLKYKFDTNADIEVKKKFDSKIIKYRLPKMSLYSEGYSTAHNRIKIVSLTLFFLIFSSMLAISSYEVSKGQIEFDKLVFLSSVMLLIFFSSSLLAVLLSIDKLLISDVADQPLSTFQALSSHFNQRLNDLGITSDEKVSRIKELLTDLCSAISKESHDFFGSLERLINQNEYIDRSLSSSTEENIERAYNPNELNEIRVVSSQSYNSNHSSNVVNRLRIGFFGESKKASIVETETAEISSVRFHL